MMTTSVSSNSIPHSLKARLRPLRKRYQRISRNLQNFFSKPNEQAIYIVGHPRSGTTAIAQLLGDYAGLDVAQEKRWATNYVKDLHDGRMSLDSFLKRYAFEFSRPIVQTPGLVPILPMLRERFPRVRLVYILRDPRDVVCSTIAMTNRTDRNEFVVNDPGSILFDNGWIGIDESDPVRSLAKRWCYCLQIADRYSDIPFYRYEDFTADKQGFIDRLSHELGLRQKVDIADLVDVQYRGVGVVRGPNRWKQMLPRQNVSDIEEICSSGMRRFGYEFSTNQSTD